MKTLLILLLFPVMLQAQIKAYGTHILPSFIIEDNDPICQWRGVSIEPYDDSLTMVTYEFKPNWYPPGEPIDRATLYVLEVINRVIVWEGKDKCNILRVGNYIYYNGKPYAEILYIVPDKNRIKYTIKFKNIVTNYHEN